ncbi:uncharacterized protein ARMOST_18706 [Armillaria ostoyae]|uniref:Uncharacterized protein n=1 Tax=Armillaria ostoyae TaxID=47428 RepID=A0A284S2I4_ARMOS|nr:uncharacterized protein ARMOST_18706 [Armillaria ostoyae]
MRVGKGEKKWVVNMWGRRDAVLADYALDQFIKHVQQRKRFSFPKHLVFQGDTRIQIGIFLTEPDNDNVRVRLESDELSKDDDDEAAELAAFALGC